ncbi:MAG: protein kinase, partial [Eubacteriales bacterium]|nr:protein kinase [Eubacteriales bacterium]
MNIHMWPDWEIVRKIGAGSYGEVYEIQRGSGSYLEKAALKVIRVPSGPAELEQLRADGIREEDMEACLSRQVEEIRNEIGIMQRFVGFSNIVSYEDYLIRKHPQETGWDILIRMELLTSLPEYMSSCPLTEADALRLGMDISQALIICHEAGIIHRDIKPQNIFLNDHGFYKLGDFGISGKPANGGSVPSIKGAVSYMAPETFDMQGADARSDIYSLALVIYRILNGGREPFLTSPGFTPAQKEEAQRRRLSGERLPRPAGISDRFWAVLSKALQGEPGARYQTAAQFYEALRRCVSGEAAADAEKTVTILKTAASQPVPSGSRQNQTGSSGSLRTRTGFSGPSSSGRTEEGNNFRHKRADSIQEPLRTNRGNREDTEAGRLTNKKTKYLIFALIAAEIVLALLAGGILLSQKRNRESQAQSPASTSEASSGSAQREKESVSTADSGNGKNGNGVSGAVSAGNENGSSGPGSGENVSSEEKGNETGGTGSAENGNGTA